MKILKYFTILAAAVGLMSACTSDLEHVQTLPADQVVAPVLHDLESDEVVITSKTLINTFKMSWEPAYFGDNIVPSYSILIARADSDDWASIAVGVTATEVSLTYEQINLAATEGLGLPIDVATDTQVRIGATIGNSYQTFYSEAKALKVTPSSMEKTYNMIYMPGSYQGWSPGDAATKFQVLYEFTGNGVFEGIADFGASADASREWKFTREANWDFDWGIPSGETPEAEAKEVTLINNDGGDRSNINIYTAKRFYHFTMDTNSGLLKHNYSFDQVGVVGEINSWNGDEVMEFNAAKRRFYVDIENFSGEFKFRADAAWDMNWGGAAFGLDGDNLKVEEAGNYRVYLYMSNSAEMSYELNADMFGKEEPTGGQTPDDPEPTPTEDVYGLVGTHNGWGSGDTVLAAHNGDWLAAKGFECAEGNEFKIRVNEDWAVNYGGDSEADGLFAITAGEKYTLVSGGKNLTVAAGSYDVYFNKTSFEFIAVVAGSADPTLPSEAKAVKFYADVTATGWTNCNIYGWGDLGDYGGGWPGTALSTETIDGKEYYTFAFGVEAFGKTVNVIFNNGSEQTVDIKDVVLDKDYIFTLTEKDGSGKWLATLNGEAPVTPDPPAETTYGLIGEFNGWSDPDVDLVARGDGWYVVTNVAISGKFLIRLNDGWDEKFGNDGSDLVIGENTLTYGGADMPIASGTYDFYFNPATSKLFVANAGDADPTPAPSISYGLVGTINGWGGSPDIAFEAIGDGGYKLLGQALTTADAIKIRANNEWNDAENYGLPTAGVLTTNAANTLICGGGSKDMSVAADGTYDFYFYPAELKLYCMEAGQVPAR